MSFFESPEVKLLLTTVENLAPRFEKNLAFDEVRKRVEKSIRDNPEAARKALVQDNRTPEEVCLTALVNTVQQDLRSGDERHVGGMLTLIGQQRKALYSTALGLLVEIGFLSEADRKVNETQFVRELSERFD